MEKFLTYSIMKAMNIQLKVSLEYLKKIQNLRK